MHNYPGKYTNESDIFFQNKILPTDNNQQSNYIQPSNVQHKNKNENQKPVDDLFDIDAEKRIFNEHDLSNTGTLSKVELYKAIKKVYDLAGFCKVSDKDIDDILNVFDINGDNVIDFKEFQLLVQKLKGIILQR